MTKSDHFHEESARFQTERSQSWCHSADWKEDEIGQYEKTKTNLQSREKRVRIIQHDQKGDANMELTDDTRWVGKPMKKEESIQRMKKHRNKISLPLQHSSSTRMSHHSSLSVTPKEWDPIRAPSPKLIYVKTSLERLPMGSEESASEWETQSVTRRDHSPLHPVEIERALDQSGSESPRASFQKS